MGLTISIDPLIVIGVSGETEVGNNLILEFLSKNFFLKKNNWGYPFTKFILAF